MRVVGKEGWFEEREGERNGRGGTTVSPGCDPAARNVLALSGRGSWSPQSAGAPETVKRDRLWFRPSALPLCPPRLWWHYRTHVSLLDFQPLPRQYWPIVAGVTKREEKHCGGGGSQRVHATHVASSTRSGVSIWLGTVTSTPSL